MSKLSEDTIKFILEHRNEDTRQLALKIKHNDNIDPIEVITQIAGWQIAVKKIPSWAKNNNILYPKHLSMEQCSSETTAIYKSTLIKGDTFTDLTAGFGIDCYFISRNFNHADYVETAPDLCNIARHNFNVLNDSHITVHNDDCINYLNNMRPVDCIFLDPSRRDENGGKTVAITDCTPDITKIENLLVEKGKTVMIKLSPMLDIHSAFTELKHINSLHIISVNNECKELVLILGMNSNIEDKSHDDITIKCVQIANNSPSQYFEFKMSEEKCTEIHYSNQIKDYLYEPGASILKAGAFKLLSSRYGIDKLQTNSHLYTSDKIIDFPGRRFKVIETSTFNKKDIKNFLRDVDKANITIRNFPSTVAELRKKLKLKEGGDLYIFATTLDNGEKILIKCRNISSFLTK